jgi:putative ABC transport system substrate-binding protein
MAFPPRQLRHREKARTTSVEQPTQIELWINLKTAKALGLDIPMNLRQLADQLIE